MATWLISHGPQIVHLALAFFAGVVFAAWRETVIERRWINSDDPVRNGDEDGDYWWQDQSPAVRVKDGAE